MRSLGGGGRAHDRGAGLGGVELAAVLDAGQLVSTGSHSQLLEECELYARLANLQFREPGLTNGGLPDSADASGPYVPG